MNYKKIILNSIVLISLCNSHLHGMWEGAIGAFDELDELDESIQQEMHSRNVNELRGKITSLITNNQDLSMLTKDSPLLNRYLYADLSEYLPILLKNKANPNIESNGYTPLYRAISLGKENAVTLLLEAGADPNDNTKMISFDETSPLHHAIECGNKKIVELLLKFNAHPNIVITDQSTKTPLITAISKGLINMEKNRLSIIELLLQYGANPLICGENNTNALAIAQKRLLKAASQKQSKSHLPQYKKIVHIFLYYYFIHRILCGEFIDENFHLPQEIVEYILRFVDFGFH